MGGVRQGHGHSELPRSTIRAHPESQRDVTHSTALQRLRRRDDRGCQWLAGGQLHRGSRVCTSVQAASLAKATEVLSVPWQLLSGPSGGSIRLRATLPPCGHLVGISGGGSEKAWRITVGAVVPDVLGRCGSTQSITQTVDLGPPGNPPGAPPPPVSAATRILHGPIGPVALALAPLS